MYTSGRSGMTRNNSGGLVQGLNSKNSYNEFVDGLRGYAPMEGGMRRTWSSQGRKSSYKSKGMWSTGNKLSKNDVFSPNFFTATDNQLSDQAVPGPIYNENPMRNSNTDYSQRGGQAENNQKFKIGYNKQGRTSNLPLSLKDLPFMQGKNFDNPIPRPSEGGLNNNGSRPFLIRPGSGMAQHQSPDSSRHKACKGDHTKVPLEQYAGTYGTERPRSALQAKQMQQAAILSQPKWRETPFEQYIRNSDRTTIAKRKAQYQNRLFN